MDDNKKLLRNLAAIQRKLSALYGATYKSVVEISEVREAIEKGEDFTFNGNISAANKAEKLLNRLASATNALIVNGIEASFTMGRKTAGDDIAAMAGNKEEKNAVKEITEQAEKDYREEGSAAHAFITKKRGGLTLSDKVWNLKGNARKELEIIIQNGVIEGKSADEISRSVRQYLNNPQALFRRVKNKDTQVLELSQAAKDYHPGRGVYRSAYKNAMRLARTEVNAAYRTAMWQAWQNEPLIEAYEIRLSNNHTTTNSKGQVVPLKDICDELAGVYPKSFYWVGWHPQCRCDMIPVKVNRDTFKDAIRAIKKGELQEWSKQRNDEQKEKPLPNNFVGWYKKNKGRFKDARILPYFLEDNRALLKMISKKTPLPAPAPKAITTYDRQIDEIKRWQRALGLDSREIGLLDKLRLGGNEEALRNKVGDLYDMMTDRQVDWLAENRKLKDLVVQIPDQKKRDKYEKISDANRLDANGNMSKSMAAIKKAYAEVQALLSGPTSFIGKNMKQAETILGTTQGKPMTHDEADHERANPNYGKGKQYSINCQSCVVAYELRRRGFDVMAYGNTGPGSIPYKVSYQTELAWNDENGNVPKANRAGGLDTSKLNGLRFRSKPFGQMMAEFESLTAAVGRYHVSFAHKGGRNGHIITAERHPDGTLTLFDPQPGREIKDYMTYFMKFASPSRGLNVLRVDGLGINPAIIGGVVLKR